MGVGNMSQPERSPGGGIAAFSLVPGNLTGFCAGPHAAEWQGVSPT